MNDVASVLGAAVNAAMTKLARDHPAMARRLNWSLEAVDKNPAHARELLRKDLARQAVVELVAQQQRPRAAAESTERRKRPDIWERGAAAFRQEVGREIHAVTHPTEALAEYIHNRRTWPGGGRLARANDIVGGSLAGMAADTIEGVGELGDLYRRYGQGGIIEDALAKRGLIAPPPKYADQAARFTAPLRREAELRPPRTFAGKALAAVPKIAGVVAAPELIGTTLLATQGLGSAHHRARQTHAPDNPQTDVGIAATAAVDALAGRLLKTGRFPDAARVIERLPEQARGLAQDLVARTVIKSGAGGAIAGGQTLTDNLVAKGTYDPQRPWREGIGESLIFGGAVGSIAGRNGRPQPPSRPPLPGPPTPPRLPDSFAIQLAGAHRDVRGLRGYEAHHMPSDSASPLPRSKGPAIALHKADHMRTASHGGSRLAKEYRLRQKALIDAGDFAAAQDMDVNDIRMQFGDKYADAVEQLIAHSKTQGHRQ